MRRRHSQCRVWIEHCTRALVVTLASRSLSGVRAATAISPLPDGTAGLLDGLQWANGIEVDPATGIRTIPPPEVLTGMHDVSKDVNEQYMRKLAQSFESESAAAAVRLDGTAFQQQGHTLSSPDDDLNPIRVLWTVLKNEVANELREGPDGGSTTDLLLQNIRVAQERQLSQAEILDAAYYDAVQGCIPGTRVTHCPDQIESSPAKLDDFKIHGEVFPSVPGDQYDQALPGVTTSSMGSLAEKGGFSSPTFPTPPVASDSFNVFPGLGPLASATTAYEQSLASLFALQQEALKQSIESQIQQLNQLLASTQTQSLITPYSFSPLGGSAAGATGTLSTSPYGPNFLAVNDDVYHQSPVTSVGGYVFRTPSDEYNYQSPQTGVVTPSDLTSMSLRQLDPEAAKRALERAAKDLKEFMHVAEGMMTQFGNGLEKFSKEMRSFLRTADRIARIIAV